MQDKFCYKLQQNLPGVITLGKCEISQIITIPCGKICKANYDLKTTSIIRMIRIFKQQ